MFERMENQKKTATLLALGALMLLSGCASMTVHSTVQSDGTIEEYRIEINTTRQAYGYIEQAAENQGYNNVREYILSDVNESRMEDITYDEEFSSDQVHITFAMENFNPGKGSSISITKEDGNLIYHDTTFLNESYQPSSESNPFTAGISVDYYLTMPGEIVDTNADSVDGDTAEWHESGEEAYQNLDIRATSETGTIVGVSGFGVGVAAVALLLTAGFLIEK